MKRIFGVSGVLMAMLGCATSPSREAFVATRPPEGIPTGFLNKAVDLDGKLYRYVVYVPYTYRPEEAWPLIVFLHGSGQRGDDGLAPSEVGLGNAIRKNPERFPAIVVMPQCPADKFWDTALPAIETAIAETKAAYHIDESRLYLTGMSMGAYAVWLWGAMQTERFAALMPVCGGGRLEDIQTRVPDTPLAGLLPDFETRVQNLANVPIWAFHGAQDETVPVDRSRAMVEAVRAAGGTVHYTEYPDVGHFAWEPAYDDAKAIAWLFKQRRE